MKNLRFQLRDADFAAQRQQPPQSDGPQLDDLISAARRQYLPVIFFGIVGLLLGLAHFATSPKTFYAAANVLVDEKMNNLGEEITANIPTLRNDTALLNELQVFQSLALASEVTRRLELHKNEAFLNPVQSEAGRFVGKAKAFVKSFIPKGAPPPVAVQVEKSAAEIQAETIQSVAASLAGRIDIERVDRSFAVAIGFSAQDPILTAEIVNTYAEAYLEDHIQSNLEASDRTGKWMRTRLAELSQDANDATRAAEDFKSQNGVSNVQGLRELEQRAEALSSLYQAIAQRYEQIAIEGSFPVTNGRILTRAITPTDAAAPKAWQILSLGTLIGLLFGFSIAVFRETNEIYFRTGDDVYKYTGRPFLGYLPVFKSSKFKKIEAKKSSETSREKVAGFMSLRNSAAANDPDDTAPESSVPVTQSKEISGPLVPQFFIPVLDPYSIFSETLRNIHAALDFDLSGGPGRVVAFSSMLPGEGKTTLAANFANSAAKAGCRTLLIDADVRHPALSNAFGCSGKMGLIHVLDGQCPILESLQRITLTGVDFLPCTDDATQPHPNEVFHLRDMEKFVNAMRNHYDCIVLDVPPIGSATDAKPILKLIDGIVVVTEWGATPRDILRKFVAREPAIAPKILGVVLNKVVVGKLRKYGTSGGTERYIKQFARRTA